ncbi:cyclin-like protein [Syncephalis plumigaleata]|nr:cyclin-like protein [Syncephalis plumigaleata]
MTAAHLTGTSTTMISQETVVATTASTATAATTMAVAATASNGSSTNVLSPAASSSMSSPSSTAPSTLPMVDFMPAAANTWLFPREELERTPSSEDHISLAEELSLRSKALVLATACAYLHRFYMTRSLKDFQCLEMAATALWVATKVEEQTRRLDEFAKACVCKAMKATSASDRERDKWCNVVVYGEAALLEAICFDLVVEHPYVHLLLFVQEHKVPDQISHAAWAFLNESLRSPLCVLYPPNTIAAAALHAAGLRVGVLGRVSPDGPEWWQLMGVPLADVEEAVLMMVEESVRIEKTNKQSNNKE